MKSEIWSGRKRPKRGRVKKNARHIIKSACYRRSAILLLVFICLGRFQLVQADGYRKTNLPPRTEDHEKTFSKELDYSTGKNENETESNTDALSNKKCGDTGEGLTFPNLDYSLLGYNILKGYPLSVGHDPGFRLPIFVADYSSGQRTADCRYKVPKGLLIVHDVSCEISFSSKVARTQFEMAKALSVSANVGGGGWGVEFSASAEYKASSSEMRSGEYVFIVSTATCGHYFNELFTTKPPTLHPLFTDWVKRLDTNNKEIFFEFFDNFGTHFAKRVTHGARYSFQYKMQWDAYMEREQANANIALEASYSGWFSVSGGVGMTSDQKKAAESFSKSVEWKLITTGAVPTKEGGANAWAAAVKEYPLPIAYDLVSIENLFTPPFMPGYDKKKLKAIAAKIANAKMEYCHWLRKKGNINSCAALKPGIEMPDVRLHHDFSREKSSYTECIDSCLEDSRCLAITFCLKCRMNSDDFEICYKYGTQRDTQGNEDRGWISVIFYEKIHQTFSLSNTIIKGSPRTLKKSDRKSSQTRCLQLCLKDVRCTAFTHRSGSYRKSTCMLYGADYINGLSKRSGAQTKFVTWRQKARVLQDVKKLQHSKTDMNFQQVG